jgi:type IV secretory pathway VirB4 component
MPFTPFKRKNPRRSPGTEEVLRQAESVFERGVLTLRDIVAPSALEVNQNWIRVGEYYARTMFVFSYPRFLSSGWLSPIVNLDQTFDISVFIQPIDTSVVLMNLRKKIAEVESQIALREEKGYVRDPILETAYRDIEELRDKLQQASVRLFQLAIYLTIWGTSPQELDEIETVVRALLEGKMIYVKTAVFQQEAGLKSTLPFGEDRIRIATNLDSETIATAFPFVSFDLTSDRGILYGINRHNNSLVLFDRFSLANANSVTFGVTGSGKSYATKLEILRSLMFDTDVIVIDPEQEYDRLAEAVGGAFFPISLTSKYHINPFDLPLPVEGESPGDLFKSHILELIGLLRIMLGKLTPAQEAMLDQAVNETYASRNITSESDFTTVTPPLLSDLVTILESLEGGQELATRLKKYTEGSYAGFVNRPSNVDLKNRLVIFNIRNLEDELRPVAMYLILHYIWNLVRSDFRKRLLIVDEAWWIMKYPEGAAFLYGIAKRARKYFLGLSTITQDVADFMSSPYGQAVVANAAMQLLFKQSPATIDAVQKTFALTDEEKYLLLESAVGNGLFFAEQKHVAIQVVASYTEDRLITTKPEEVAAMRET